MPNSLKQKYLEQFARLEAIGIEVFRSRDTETPYALDHVDLSKFTSWRTRVTNLLSIVLPGKSPIRKIIDNWPHFKNLPESVSAIIATLTACRDDFELELFSDVEKQIEASIAINYIEQAEDLLSGGSKEGTSHIPAAVLAGAVLEKSLRTLCEKNDPPISLVKPGGKNKTLNPLIDDLKSAGIFNEIYAK